MPGTAICAAHAVTVSGKIIRPTTGTANNHRVGGIIGAACCRQWWSRPPYS